MGSKQIQKVSYAANTFILIFVSGLMAFFHYCQAEFLVYFSIPTICIYLIGYFLIYKDKLDIYLWMVIFWITLYMCITTVFLGYAYGFHLYCFSMIPIMFITEYIAYKLRRRHTRALPFTLAIAFFYLLCTGYVSYFGPIYERDQKIASIFACINAISVFAFLITYSHMMVTNIIQSEEKLKSLAQLDRLTNLYNRHYMIGCLEAVSKAEGECFLAMADIDNFKKINDRYGHNVGDLVLKRVADLMKELCVGCEVSRWGGEEFLILIPGEAMRKMTGKKDGGKEILEKLRVKIAEEKINADGQEFNVTITVGAAYRQQDQTIDSWIQTADERLYYGKNHGKNMVVIE